MGLETHLPPIPSAPKHRIILAIAVSSLVLRPEPTMSSSDEYADDGALLIHEAFPKCKDEPDTERGGFAPEAPDGGCAPEDPIKSESEQDQEDDPKTKVLK